MASFSLGTCWNLRESLKAKTIPVWTPNPSLYFPREILYSIYQNQWVLVTHQILTLILWLLFRISNLSCLDIDSLFPLSVLPINSSSKQLKVLISGLAAIFISLRIWLTTDGYTKLSLRTLLRSIIVFIKTATEMM